ncbi:hypothetical protein BOX37_26625 [Nocardia mangyaensis]|uniref:Uncharacterized protein n=1 Tax=Nocardia mangyaensis TaxID=2213200 RepID=A0A1J0VY40_9NOCA|nr:hypothetical protein BOX37_26625 [Nocardia mangyaensis]
MVSADYLVEGELALGVVLGVVEALFGSGTRIVFAFTIAAVHGIVGVTLAGACFLTAGFQVQSRPATIQTGHDLSSILGAQQL